MTLIPIIMQKVVIVSSIVDIIHPFLSFFQIGSNHV